MRQLGADGEQLRPRPAQRCWSGPSTEGCGVMSHAGPAPVDRGRGAHRRSLRRCAHLREQQVCSYGSVSLYHDLLFLFKQTYNKQIRQDILIWQFFKLFEVAPPTVLCAPECHRRHVINYSDISWSVNRSVCVVRLIFVLKEHLYINSRKSGTTSTMITANS